MIQFSTEWTRWAKTIAIVDAVVIVTAIVLDLGWGMDQFGEMGIVTLLSVALLLLNGWLAYKVFKIRFTGGKSLQVSATIWGLIALGCIFLAADEFFRIHESIDEWIHLSMEMKETAVSDRLDDVLIFFYMLGAVAVMAFYQNELRKFSRLWPWLVSGFACATCMVLLDALTNREDILPLFFDPPLARIIHLGLCGTEDTLKIIAESIFALMFLLIRELASAFSEK